MHLIIDIRNESIVDTIITRYASSWVDLWKTRHSRDDVSYIHFDHQKCPENGKSIIVQSTWNGRGRALSVPGTQEIFRCINFSLYAPYDTRIITISHIFDHANSLYPLLEKSWIGSLKKKYTKSRIKTSGIIIVPSLPVGQETVDIMGISEDNIEIIPYIGLIAGKGDRLILHQLSISGPYWIYDGSYGSEANIYGLLRGYKEYRSLGGLHCLLLMGHLVDTELGRISDLIQKMSLTGFVRIIGVLEAAHIESLYIYASGWLYIGAYYTGGPRIELARTHKIALLLSDIPSLSDYNPGSIIIHPNHLGGLGQSLRDLEQISNGAPRKIKNEDIMKAYEKIIAEKR